MKGACAVLYYHLWPVWPHHILPHYVINCTISNFVKIRPVRAEMSHSDRRTDRNEEANNRFSHSAEGPNMKQIPMSSEVFEPGIPAIEQPQI